MTLMLRVAECVQRKPEYQLTLHRLLGIDR
jgi:hypothetical protein